MTKLKTNDEFVKELMMFSRRGALIHPFVLQALRTFSSMVVDSYESGELSQKMQGNSLVSPDAWADCAKEVLEKLDVQYGDSKKALN